MQHLQVNADVSFLLNLSSQKLYSTGVIFNVQNVGEQQQPQVNNRDCCVASRRRCFRVVVASLTTYSCNSLKWRSKLILPTRRLGSTVACSLLNHCSSERQWNNYDKVVKITGWGGGKRRRSSSATRANCSVEYEWLHKSAGIENEGPL